MLLKSRVRHYIRTWKSAGKRPIEGGANMYAIAMMMILFLIFVFKAMLDDQRLQVTHDAVDDALVSSLISASSINVREYGRSGQLVIYDDVTQDPVVGVMIPPLTEEQKAQRLLDNAKLYQPATDSYLNKAYNAFENSLAVNLKLDGSMNATISGINGTVDIPEFSIYNLFEYYDRNGSRLHYRFVKYTFNGSAWSADAYPWDTPVSVYNSFDKTYTTLDSTTVTAQLKFTVRIAENYVMLGIGDMTQEVTYQRLVDVTD